MLTGIPKALKRAAFTITVISFVLVSVATGAHAAGAGDDVFAEIMAWTQSEIEEAGRVKDSTDGSQHSGVFVGDNRRYDDGRGEVKRQSFIEGELFKGANIALTGQMAREVVEEIKLKTKPEDWYRQIKQAKAAMGKQSLDKWYQELAECKTVCAQIVVRMMAKHFEAISKLPHFFVMFRIGSDSIDSSYDGFLDQIATYLKRDKSLQVMIVGRASKIGDRAYNRELSRKRADSIKYRLLKRDLDLARLKIVYLGYEPPQLTRNVIDLYGLENPVVNLNHRIVGLDLYQINQSAIIALVKN